MKNSDFRFISVSKPFHFRFISVSKPFQFRFKFVSKPFQNRFKNGIKVDVARNPCPCGFFPDRNKCHCTENEIKRYQKGISKPILERIDICAESCPIKFDELATKETNEKSASIKKRITIARNIQKERFKNYKNIKYNAQMTVKEINKYCVLTNSDQEFLKDIFSKKRLSARTYHKILKVARTIADLKEKENIDKDILIEASNFRGLEEHIYG